MEASEFDEWFEGEMPNSHKKVNKERIETVIYSCAEASWDHQQAKIDEMQEQLRIEREQGTEYFNQKLQARVDVYELHIKTLKNIHENDFNEESESSYILGNLDGFFECIEADLKGNKDEN